MLRNKDEGIRKLEQRISELREATLVRPVPLRPSAEPGAGVVLDSLVAELRLDDGVEHVLQRCPITYQRITDPVVAADGQTYEREAITQWMQQSDRSPFTNEPFAHKHLVSNYFARHVFERADTNVSVTSV